MGISVLLILGVLCAVVLGIILAVVLMLSNERVRAVIKAFLAVPLVFLITLLVYWWQRSTVVHPRPQRTTPVQMVASGSADDACGPGMRRADFEQIAFDPGGLPLPAETDEEFRAAAPGSAEDPGGNEMKRALYARILRAMTEAIFESPETASPAPEPRIARAVKAKEERRPPAETSPDPDQPKWVDASPQQVGGVYRMPISVGPYATRAECERELPKAVRAALDEYVELYLGPKAAGRVVLPLDYVQRHAVSEDWLETRQVSVSPTKQIPMVRLHVLLEFDRAVNMRLDEAWHRAVIHGKLWNLGTLGTMLLACLSALWAYLRIDLATGGAYRGRLRFAAGLALVLAVVAGLAFLA